MKEGKEGGSFSDLWNNTKYVNGVPEGEVRENCTEEILEEIMASNCLTQSQIQRDISTQKSKKLSEFRTESMQRNTPIHTTNC